MMQGDDLIRRIVSRSGIARSEARRDLERELRAHLEDAAAEIRAQNRDALDAICDRFGDPDEIARQLQRVHRFDRLMLRAREALGLIGISILIVAAFIAIIQLTIAISFGVSPSHAFPRLRGEVAAFVALALGYTGLSVEEPLFRRFRLWKAFWLNSALFVGALAFAAAVFHVHAAAPVLPYLAGVAVRILQRTPLRPFWYVGTIVPVAAASLSLGRLLHLGHETPLWAAVLIRWVGMTAACYGLTRFLRNHETRRGAAG